MDATLEYLSFLYKCVGKSKMQGRSIVLYNITSHFTVNYWFISVKVGLMEALEVIQC